MSHDTYSKANQRHRESRSVPQSVSSNRRELPRSTGNRQRPSDGVGRDGDSKTLAHVFEREIRDYLKTADVQRGRGVHFNPSGMVGKLIASDPLSDKSLAIMADNYSQAHLGYGQQGRKSFLDGAYAVIYIINQIIQNQG